MLFLTNSTNRYIFCIVRYRSLSLLFLSIMLLSSCGTIPPKSTFLNSASNLKVGSDDTIVILRPLLKFERIHDEAVISAADYDGDAIETSLVTMAKNIIGSRDIALTNFKGRNEDESGINKKLISSIPKLSRGIVNNVNGDLIKSVATIDAHITVLVSYVRVKVGSDGSWNANSGAITSSNSKTILHAALIQCATGKVLWMDQVLLREVPQISSSRFSEALELLFLKFPQKES